MPETKGHDKKKKRANVLVRTAKFGIRTTRFGRCCGTVVLFLVWARSRMSNFETDVTQQTETTDSIYQSCICIARGC